MIEYYRNDNTGEVHHVVKVERVSNPSVTVYEFEDGQCWSAELLRKYWTRVAPPKELKP